MFVTLRPTLMILAGHPQKIQKATSLYPGC
jgi:hypothetical protein